MNKFTLSGRIFDEPIYSTSQSGKGILKFKIAVTKEYKNKDGKYESDFFDITALGKTADYAARNLEKGAQAVVEASVHNNNFTDKNGIKHYSYSFLANSIEIPYGRDAASVMSAHYNKALAEKQAANANYSGKPDPQQLRQAQQRQQQTMEEHGFVEVDDSNLPFE